MDKKRKRHEKKNASTKAAKLEWVFGITDSHPSKWKRCEPIWADEQLSATDSHTLYEVVEKLCDTAVKKRREYDWKINEHLWKLTILPPNYKRKSPFERAYDSEDDDDEKPVIVMPTESRDPGMQDDEDRTISPKTRLSPTLVPSGYTLHLMYDYGSTTDLYLKVLSVKPVGARRLITYFEDEGNYELQQRDLQAVPAYHLPVEKQLDSYYPNVSKAFLGQYVPLYEEKDSNASTGYSYRGKNQAIGCVTLGLSSRIRFEKDTTFCSMENSSCSSDLLFCSQPMDMNEFLAVSEKAWTPRKKNDDADQLDRYRYNSIVRLIFSSEPEHDEVYNNVCNDASDNDFGPKRLLIRENRADNEVLSGFDFSKVFPKTNAQFTSGRFRWFQFKNKVLRVLAGRAIGVFNRDFGTDQILRTWKRDFSTFHELMCAVEASWNMPGSDEDLDASSCLKDFDEDLGPSKPLPKEPKVLGKSEEAVIVSACNKNKKLVTALAIAEEADGKSVLYSGHADGTLAKWSLDENELIWRQKIYSGDSDDTHDRDQLFYVQETFGVAGIALRNHPKKKGQHLVYTWSDGFPEDVDLEDRPPAEVKAWSGLNGSLKRKYICDVGNDREGYPANPSIACVVFCQLLIESTWVDSMVVGLHCICPTTRKWESDYSDFNFEEATEVGEGNILPFYEHRPEVCMDTWVEQRGIIRAMAVIPKKYLLSYSMRHGHGFPDSMILWDLEDPGVPLRRHDFWDRSCRNPFKQQQSRLAEVVGISVSGTTVLFASNTGDCIAVVTVEDEDGDPQLQLHGYGNIGNKYSKEHGFHGRMAMCGSHAVMANEEFRDAWLFPIDGNNTHPSLDRRDGKPQDYDEDHDDDDEDPSGTKYTGREVAIGKVSFPLWGGNTPRRKKRKGIFGREESYYDGLGNGGPVELAMGGKWLVAGFSNGTIARAPHLPEEFQFPRHCDGSNHLASCSSLASDEWFCPELECHIDDSDDDDDSERGGVSGCSLM